MWYHEVLTPPRSRRPKADPFDRSDQLASHRRRRPCLLQLATSVGRYRSKLDAWKMPKGRSSVLLAPSPRDPTIVAREPYWKSAVLRIRRATCENGEQSALSVWNLRAFGTLTRGNVAQID